MGTPGGLRVTDTGLGYMLEGARDECVIGICEWGSTQACVRGGLRHVPAGLRHVPGVMYIAAEEIGVKFVHVPYFLKCIHLFQGVDYKATHYMDDFNFDKYYENVATEWIDDMMMVMMVRI